MINLKRLPNQQRGEVTHLFLRRHWITVIGIFLQLLVLIAVPVVIAILLSAGGAPIFSHPFWMPLGAVLLSVYILLVLIIIMTEFTDYYLDTWIVTTERVMNIEHHGLFSRIISEMHLNQVQDITSETHGILAFFLSYGDVHIQTAGSKQRFVFKGIDNPEDVKKKIIKLVHEDKRRHGDASK